MVYGNYDAVLNDAFGVFSKENHRGFNSRFTLKIRVVRSVRCNIWVPMITGQIHPGEGFNLTFYLDPQLQKVGYQE